MYRKPKPELEFFRVAEKTEKCVQLVDAEVHAGFPSPVEDAYQNQPIDLNKELVRHPESTFIVKVVGDSMIDEGINQGDMLVVDRSVFPSSKNITVCMYNGEFCLKRIEQRNGKVFLMPGNSKYDPIEVSEFDELRVWGVVLWVLKKKW